MREDAYDSKILKRNVTDRKDIVKKVFVLGSYGCGNRGDDAILQSIAEAFAQRNVRIYATCGKFENISKWLPVRAVPCRLNEGFSIPVLISMCRSGIVMTFRILQSDMLIYGGGSLIHDLTAYNLPFMFLWHTVAKIFGKKIVYLGMGIGPIKTDRGKKVCKKYLPQADGLFVRDQRGYDICKGLGIENVRMMKDLVFLLEEKNQCSSNPLQAMGLIKGEYVCVTASQWFDSRNFWDRNSLDFQAQIENFTSCVRTFLEKTGKKAVFVPTVFHDLDIGMKLLSALGTDKIKIVPTKYNSREMAEIIENCYCLLGVRMHSMIFAVKQGVPVLPLVYDEKVSQLLHLMELDRYAIALSEVTPEKVAEITDEILENYSSISELLKKKAAQFGTENRQIINQVLTSLIGEN